MTTTEALHAIAAELEAAHPDAAARLHRLARRVGPMEQLLDELAEDARQAEYRAMLEDNGIVVLPVGWGRA